MSLNFTEQQKLYIFNKKIENTKLLACAGSGKTRCIIFRINYLIESGKIKNNQVLMLTFSRFTRDDFINKIRKCGIKIINEAYIKTIDSFAKSLIDTNNEIDVSLLSYKFMQYLEKTSGDDLKKNKKLSSIITIFVDEAQDLNETQYKILNLLKEKCDIKINMIGDPNQNIYQFRKSSDKYLTEFKASTFYLTKNFRSYDGIIDFSKWLRPVNDIDVTGARGKMGCKPKIILHQNDSDLEGCIIKFLKFAKKSGVNFKDIAILAPTRGRMKGYGNSYGLCLVSNLLYKNKIKFKQFYEEATDEINNNIRYIPERDTINVLTYMGSKGLEWKYVLLIDANICLINKRHFTEEKHKDDRYLLYVACSRAIENVVIFSKYKNNDGNLNFQLNPWFSEIPSKYYDLGGGLEKYFTFPKVKPHDIRTCEKRITKIIDNIEEKDLDELSQLCQNSNIITKTVDIFDENYATKIQSSIFLGKYVENLFFAYSSIVKGKEKKRFIDIENVINSHLVMDVPMIVTEWYNMNRNHLSWELYEKEKKNGTLDKLIIECVEKKFNKSIKLSEHTIVNDGYFKSFILSISGEIKENYEKYLKTKNIQKIQEYLFYMTVLIYAFDTQHYFHAMSRGEKFKYILTDCKDMFNDIYDFVLNMKINIVESNIPIKKWEIYGEIDILDGNKNNEIWEVKCVSDISLKHILQVLVYNILYKNLDSVDNSKKNIIYVKTNFINLLKGQTVCIKIPLTYDNILRIKEIFTSNI